MISTDRSELDRALAFCSRGVWRRAAGAPDELRLPAAGAKVFADLGDSGDVRDRVASELLFDRCDVIAQQVEDLFPVDGGRRCISLGAPVLITPVIRKLQIDAEILLLDPWQ